MAELRWAHPSNLRKCLKWRMDIAVSLFQSNDIDRLPGKTALAQPLYNPFWVPVVAHVCRPLDSRQSTRRTLRDPSTFQQQDVTRLHRHRPRCASPAVPLRGDPRNPLTPKIPREARARAVARTTPAHNRPPRAPPGQTTRPTTFPSSTRTRAFPARAPRPPPNRPHYTPLSHSVHQPSQVTYVARLGFPRFALGCTAARCTPGANPPAAHVRTSPLWKMSASVIRKLGMHESTHPPQRTPPWSTPTPEPPPPPTLPRLAPPG